MDADQVQLTDEEQAWIDEWLKWYDDAKLLEEGYYREETYRIMLQMALGTGNPRLVQYLIFKGADVNVLYESSIHSETISRDDGSTLHINYGDMTPLDWAKRVNDTKMIEYLESMGAKSGSDVP